MQLKPERLGHDDFNDMPLSICGRSFVADMSGALFWPSQRALIVADLHLEKGSAFASRGQMLPPYDTRETLVRLAKVIDRFEAETVIALGDSLHDNEALLRMDEDDRNTLRIMQQHCDWLWITGNHDQDISKDVCGDVADAVTIAGLTLRHEPACRPETHEIAGHLHPAAKVSQYGHAVRRPCFVGNGQRLVMPAFGSYAGGLNVLDDAFQPLFGNGGLSVWMLGHEGVYPIATRLLRED